MIRILLIFLFFTEVHAEAQKKTICLNMIVKDESQVIERCLASVKGLIDYWVIVDTGSTDGTQEIIRNFLRDIPGVLIERPWVDFAHNRNEALGYAKGKGDYLLFIDADEELKFGANFSLPKLDQSYYTITICADKMEGHRAFMIDNHLDWAWKGVLHEQPLSYQVKSAVHMKGIAIDANSREGDRSKNPNKWLKDAKTLEEALKLEPANSRYVFYLAQIYEDGKDYSSALQNYEKRIKMGGCPQEIFWSKYRAACLQEVLGMASETVIHSYCEAIKASPTRAEPIHGLAKFFLERKNPFLAYHAAKFALALPCPNDLIIDKGIYESDLLIQFALAALDLGREKEAFEAFEQIKKAFPPDYFNAFINKEQKTEKPIEIVPDSEEVYLSKYQSASKQEEDKAPIEVIIDGYCKAFLARPTRAEPLFHLANYFFWTGNYFLGYIVAKAGIELPMPEDLSAIKSVYNYELLFEFANCAFEIGRIQEAKATYEKLLVRSDIPDETYRKIKKNLIFCDWKSQF